jgi:hypothetical protein
MLTDHTLRWVKKLCQKYFVVICVGGGAQINRAFQKAGLPVRKFGPLGRESKTLLEKQVARAALERNQSAVQDRLAALGIHASVVIPVVEVGTVICHVNGDQHVLTAYNGFDAIFVVTTKERVAKKQAQFAPYPKIKVIGL